MQVTFARPRTRQAKRARDDRVSCIQPHEVSLSKVGHAMGCKCQLVDIKHLPQLMCPSRGKQVPKIVHLMLKSG